MILIKNPNYNQLYSQAISNKSISNPFYLTPFKETAIENNDDNKDKKISQFNLLQQTNSDDKSLVNEDKNNV